MRISFTLLVMAFCMAVNVTVAIASSSSVLTEDRIDLNILYREYKNLFEDPYLVYATSVGIGLDDKTIEYKLAVLATPPGSGAFAYLMNPICQSMQRARERNKSRSVPTGFSEDRLAQYLASDSLAAQDGYEGKVTGEVAWAFVHNPNGPETDEYLGCVARVAEGKIAVSLIHAPGHNRHDQGFFSETMAKELQELQSMTARSQRRPLVSIGDYTLCDTRRKTYGLGMAPNPDTFELAMYHRPSNNVPSYCLGDLEMVHQWNEKYKRMQYTASRPVAGRTRTPVFRDGVLVPVDEVYRSQLDSDPRFREHDRQFNETWKRYVGLFDKESAKRIRQVQREIFKDRQNMLLAHLEDPDKFREAVREFDTPQLRYMGLLIQLMKKPDVRLIMALDPLYSGINRFLDQGEYVSDRMPASRVYAELPYTEAAFLPVHDDPYSLVDAEQDSEFEQEVADTSWPSQWPHRLEITDDAAKRVIYVRPHMAVETFRILHESKSSCWGFASYDFYGRYSREKSSSIYRVQDGKISFVPVTLPKPEDFFRAKKIPWPRIEEGEDESVYEMPKLQSQSEDPEEEPTRINLCNMKVTLDVSGSAPYEIRAVYFQANRDVYDLAWTCIPECDVPYAWKESRLVPGKPDCRSKGEWGIFDPFDDRISH